MEIVNENQTQVGSPVPSDPQVWKCRLSEIANNGASDEEVAQLAQDYSGSGAQLSIEGATADVASTGGPSSLSTLITPLLLVRSGFCVPKLGVPGRPAGGLDVLAQIPGYRIDLGPLEVREALNRCGYAHFSSAGRFAPLDAQTFRLRQSLGLQAVPELAIASLLSKKLAVGVRTVGLDVRIAPHANFGADFDTGTRNSERFIRVARVLGLKAVCVLTDARVPFQPFLGRGEALWAIRCILSGTPDPWLEAHFKQCRLMAAAVGGAPEADEQPPFEQFRDNVVAQGSSYDSFLEIAEAIEQKHRIFVESPRSGFPRYDLGALRSALISAQAGAVSDSGFPDPVGVRLLVSPAQRVERGEPLMSVRLEPGVDKALVELLASAICISDAPLPMTGDKIVE